MTMVLNQSGRSITTQLVKQHPDTRKIDVTDRFTFHPGMLTEVDDEKWKRLKKRPDIIGFLDNEELVSGSRATKKGKEAKADVENTDENAKDQANK